MHILGAPPSSSCAVINTWLSLKDKARVYETELQRLI